ncbi:hypothetical protein EYZ11_006154 [Aspergillus tanneri]|uniref:Major facilitator superfamily (MFS) profile domain-containing protein n=1 Tax=Aspergillus tanneri TaxID=1220188 RepID=A0A4S3JG57_9EURO|nr:hypothetical protein EYZ11_006154 [Aspergillus tanneri]
METETQVQESESPPRLLLKLISAGFAFFVAGINDGSLGALIPYIREAYQIDTNLVAVVYGTTFAGWFVAALSNSHLGQYLHLGVFLVLGAAMQVLAHALRTWMPPFGLFAVTFFFAALGQAYQDTYANTFVASVKAAHRWLGFIHAMYMAGCLVGPFVSTAVASAGTQSRWNLFYTAPLGLGVVNLVLVLVAFRDSLAFKHGVNTGQEARSGKIALQEIWQTLSLPSVWVLRWIVEYLVHVRDGDLKQMGYVPAGFYGGAFIGRLVLAEPTYRLGERRMIIVYVLLCLALELVFWLPLLRNGDIRGVEIIQRGDPILGFGYVLSSQNTAAANCAAFIFVLGQVGGAIFPAITGVLAARSGVKVLQPILVGLLGATGVTWLMLPKGRLHHD